MHVLHSVRSRASRGRYGLATAWVAVLCLLVFPPPALSAEIAVVRIIVNQQVQGDFLVSLAQDGELFIKISDFPGLGLKDPDGPVTIIDDERFISVRAVPGLSPQFDRNSVTLHLTADPGLIINRRTIDMSPSGASGAYTPRDNSAFLNYGLQYRDSDDDPHASMNVTNQLGIRFDEYLFLNDAIYRKTGSEADAVRLMTSVIHDRRADMQRVIAGDFVTPSGTFSGSLTMGGVSFSKAYSINPAFIRTPLLSFEGLVTLPSQADVYLNGVKVRTEQFAPGSFEIKDLASYGGTNMLEVVIRDSLGREQRLVYPFYSSDALLKRGLHEYSYNAGFLREAFGIASNEYGDYALTGFHRYGVTDTLTVGIQADATDGFVAAGPEVTFVPKAGAITLAGTGSRHEGDRGYAAMLSYTFQGRIWNARALTRRFSRDFTTISSLSAPVNIRDDTAAGVSVTMRNLGTVSVDAAISEPYEGPVRRSVGVTYSKTITGSAFIYATATTIKEERRENRFFVGFNYTFGPGPTLSARYTSGPGTSSEAVQLQQSPPPGEGYGYRASIERQHHGGTASDIFNPFLQYNGPVGIYSVDYLALRSADGGTRSTYQLAAAGSIVAVGRTVGVTRPVDDSFALVQVGEVEGVRVYQNNQEVGRTDADGKAFVPNVGSYQNNSISINDRDLPMEVSFQETRRLLLPPLRSGSCLFFNALKSRPVTGAFSVRLKNSVVPVEHTEVVLLVEGKPVTFTTGLGGEFYLDSLAPDDQDGRDGRTSECVLRGGSRETRPGVYHGSFSFKGTTCSFTILVPITDDLIIDLGTITACSVDAVAAPSGAATPH